MTIALLFKEIPYLCTKFIITKRNRTMKKLFLILVLTTALPLGRLSATPNDNGGTNTPERVSLCKFTGKDSKRAVARADADKQGVTAPLQYVQLPDMKTPRQGHQTIPTDGGLMVVGGHSTGYINTTFGQELSRAYVFNPPVAGTASPAPDGGGEAGDHVVIESTNGETVSFLLSEDPHFKFIGQTVTVTTAEVTIDYQAEEIARVYLTKDSPSGIDISELPAKKDGKLSIEAGHIVITGLQAGEPASVYQLTGVLSTTKKADQEGRLVISIDDLPAKVCIIKTKHQSFKIIKK